MAYGDPKISAVILYWYPSKYTSICKPYISNTELQTTSLGKIIATKQLQVPIPAAALSKACVLGLSLAGIAGSNPVGGMDVECCVLSEVAALEGELQSTVCLSMTVKPRKWGGPGPIESVTPWKKIPRATLCLGKPTVAQKGMPTTLMERAGSLWLSLRPWSRRIHSTLSTPVPLKSIWALKLLPTIKL